MQQPTNQPPSKLRVAMAWLLPIAVSVFCFVVVWSARAGRNPNRLAEPNLAGSIVILTIGAFFTAVGVVGYFIATYTHCFTFNLGRPVWPQLKVKIFLANIIVPLAFGLGVGLMVAAFVTPVLHRLGLDAGLARMAPILGVLVLLQFATLWVVIWSPMERSFIIKRLAALGITEEQCANGHLVGISNPASGAMKRFGTIEEDMGVLWVSGDQLIFYGDGEQFAISRGEVMQIERKADKGSTTMLGGVAHVILHLRRAEGERQIRLHPEGIWTMGQKRVAMDRLGDEIVHWKNQLVVPPPIPGASVVGET